MNDGGEYTFTAYEVASYEPSEAWASFRRSVVPGSRVETRVVSIEALMPSV